MSNINYLYKRNEDKTIKCLACNHYCVIPQNKAGICGIRKNINGKLKLTVLHRPIAVNIDPIEKKPLFHFLPGTKIFSIGTIGCNFKCLFCQNWDISQTKESNNNIILKPKEIIEYCLKNNIPSIAYTYNEPTIFFEYNYEIAKLARANGIKNVYVSNGYMSIETLEAITPYLDAINIDLKAFSKEFYINICKANIEKVKENIIRIYEKNIWIELTTLIIPGKNDSKHEINNLTKFVTNISPNIPLHFSRFFPCYKMSDLHETPIKTLLKCYKIAKDNGLKYVYIGNTQTNKYENTYCPKCNEILIKREGFSTKRIGINKNKCIKCNYKLDGIFE